MDEDRARALLRGERERAGAVLERHREELDEARRGGELTAVGRRSRPER